MRSILGKGKLSFGHALFMSVKSIQSRHLPFAFLTSTTLANHSGYSTSLIALALLLDWFEGWVGVQPMSDYCRVDSSHVCLLPCENISILSQKLSKEAFEVFR